MKASEKISVLLSIVALAASLVSVYFQFFFINREFIVSTDELVEKDGEFYAEVVFSNTGNRRFAVSNIHLCVMNFEAQSFESAGSWGYTSTKVDGIESEIVLSKSLLEIEEGEIKVVRLSSRLDLSSGHPIANKDLMNIGVCFIAYSSKADKILKGLMPFTVRINNDGHVISSHRSEKYDQEHKKTFEL